jgi:hypothetical protein
VVVFEGPPPYPCECLCTRAARCVFAVVPQMIASGVLSVMSPSAHPCLGDYLCAPCVVSMYILLFGWTRARVGTLRELTELTTFHPTPHNTPNSRPPPPPALPEADGNSEMGIKNSPWIPTCLGGLPATLSLVREG